MESFELRTLSAQWDSAFLLIERISLPLNPSDASTSLLTSSSESYLAYNFQIYRRLFSDGNSKRMNEDILLNTEGSKSDFRLVAITTVTCFPDSMESNFLSSTDTNFLETSCRSFCALLRAIASISSKKRTEPAGIVSKTLANMFSD